MNKENSEYSQDFMWNLVSITELASIFKDFYGGLWVGDYKAATKSI